MAMDTRENDYCAFTSEPPYGAALVRRRSDGRIAVGAVYQNERALRPIIEALKAQLQKAHIDFGKIIALFEDSEQATELADMAEELLPVGWARLYRSMETARQSLESAIATQGPHSSKFQIDALAPGAENLAQAIDNRITGGVYDAVAICVARAKEDEQSFFNDDIKVLGSDDSRRDDE